MKKKVLITIIAVVALFIPTVLAVGSFLWAGLSPDEAKDVTEIVITNNDGTYTLENKDDIKPWTDLIAGAVKVDSNPLADKDIETMTVVLSFGSNDKKEYTYYLVPGEDSFFETEGVVFKIERENLNSIPAKYVTYLFASSGAPTLTVSGETILPESMSWYYKGIDGSFVALEGIETTDSAKVINISGALDYVFSLEAEYEVTMTKGSETLTADDLMNITEPTEIGVKIAAKWNESEDKDYYGEAAYSFTAKLSAPAEFYLSKGKINPGDFVVLTGKNVDDITKISFSSTPAIEFTPVFFADGDLVRALVPIKVDLLNKSYVFTVKYGSTYTKELTLEVNTDYAFTAQADWTNDKTILGSTRSEIALKEYNDVIAPIAAKQIAEKLWEDINFKSVGKDAKARGGFGPIVTLKATGEKFRNDGAYYTMAKGASVTAINSGEVIYAGSTVHTGNMVVVDHGFGLKSWYSNLSEIKVEVGQRVKAGDALGTVGGNGFVKNDLADAVFVRLTVFDVPVWPYDSGSPDGKKTGFGNALFIEMDFEKATAE